MLRLCNFAKDCRSPKKREKNASPNQNYSWINTQVAKILEDQIEDDVGFPSNEQVLQDGWSLDY